MLEAGLCRKHIGPLTASCHLCCFREAAPDPSPQAGGSHTASKLPADVRKANKRAAPLLSSKCPPGAGKLSQVVAKASRPCWVQANSWLSSTIALDSREARKWPQAPSTSHPPRLSSPHFLPPGDPGADVSAGTAAQETPAAGAGWGGYKGEEWG